MHTTPLPHARGFFDALRAAYNKASRAGGIKTRIFKAIFKENLPQK